MSRYIIVWGYRLKGGPRASLLQVNYNIAPVAVDGPDPAILLDTYAIPDGIDIHSWLDTLVAKEVIEKEEGD